MTQFLRVKNWEKFQHYKDRNPPWIKLHRELLHDYDFTCLQDASKLQLMLIWLLASQTDNKIPANADWIKTQLNIKGKVCFKELIDKGFLVDDSGMLASRKQSAMLETEAEAEAEERHSKKLALDELSVDHNAEWLAKKRMEGKYVFHDEHFILEQFKQYCQSKGKRYADYIAGYRNAFEWDRCQPKQAGHQNKSDRAKAAIMRGLSS